LDMRQPLGFEGVFRLVRPDGTEEFARIDGGLVAVFPRSVCVGGGSAVTPPGTVFHIGGLGDGSLIQFPGAERAAAFNRVDLSVDLGAEAAVGGAPGPVSLFISEDHRRQRVSELLRAAARAERAGR